MAGDGPLEQDLHRYVGQNDLGDVIRFTGAITQAAMRQLMCAADVFFLPSALEGLSMTLFEAMACGVAVVAVDIGGHSELVTVDDGILVSRGTWAEELDRYTDALARLIKDPATRRAMGRHGRDRVTAGFRLERMGERMDELIQVARRRARHVDTTEVEAAAAARATARHLRVRWALPPEDRAPTGITARLYRRSRRIAGLARRWKRRIFPPAR
jgi:glycogen synthase